MHVHTIFIIHSSAEGHLSYFPFLAIVSKEAMNMAEQEYVGYGVEAFGYMPRNGTVGRMESFIFSFLKVVHPGFQDGWTS